MSRVVFLVVFVAASMSCPAAVVFTENFEGATTTSAGILVAPTVISGTLFSVVSGSIDINGPLPLPDGWYPLLCTGAAGGNCVDTVGAGVDRGGLSKIETTLGYTLNAGSLYTLTFALGAWTGDISGSHDATVLVTLGGDYSESFGFGTLKPMPFGTAPATFTKTFVSSGGSRKLAFENTYSSVTWGGLILDNITLADVPEPSSIVLLGSGMLALLAAARRRRRA
jgi:hypothetical protein